MPNHFQLRATIDHLWRQSQAPTADYRRLRALKAITRELFAPTLRAQLNYQLYFGTCPFDVARHKLRDLYDHVNPETIALLGAEEIIRSEDDAPEEPEDPL